MEVKGSRQGGFVKLQKAYHSRERHLRSRAGEKDRFSEYLSGQACLTVALMNNTSAPRAGAKNRSGVIRESLCFLQSGIY